MRVSPVRIAALVLFPIGAACGGDGGTGPGGGGGGGGDGRAILANPSFSANIQEIFTRRGCAASQCHGAAEEAGLRLASGAYAELVNVTATSEPIIRVIPADAQNSYLVIKLEGRQSVGDRMPLNATPLDNIDLTNIRNWIDNGAPNN